MRQIRRVLLATDFSSASRKALGVGLEMAERNKATLVVLHVVPPIVRLVPSQYVPSTTWEEIELGSRAWARRELDKLIGKARAKGIRARAEFREGEPAPEIVRAAKGLRAGLIVIGTHGRTGLARALLGSVAEEVIATATCPVVTVRAAK